MRTDDLILVSTDDHVIEPPDLFEGHLSAADLEAAPRILRKEDGSDVWAFEGAEVPNVALNAVAGRPPAEYGFEPTSFDDIRAGTWDVDARITDMNANGVLGSMCFPSMTGFCGQLFVRARDRELSLRLLRAYNDWHVDEWCGAHPGRFIPLGVSPAWDPEEMAREIRRLAAKGCHAVTFSENPEKLGWPSLHSDHWDPFFAACSDEGTVVAMHIGSSSALTITSVEAPVDVTISLTPLNSAMALGDLAWSRVLKEFPDLRIALSEGGIGWIPYFLDRLDYVYEHHHAWTHQDFGDQRPSDVVKERFIFCFIDDRVGLKLLDDLNVDNITWECDYPHSDSTWPTSPEQVTRTIANLDDDVIAKLTHENAMRHFRFDPFAIRPRERCTVAALRSEAGEVDLTTKSRPRADRATSSAALVASATSILSGTRED